MILENNGTHTIYIFSDHDSRTGQTMPAGVVPAGVVPEGMQYVHPATLETPPLVVKGQTVHGVVVPQTFAGTTTEVLEFLGVHIDHEGRPRTTFKPRNFDAVKVGNVYILPTAPRLGDFIGSNQIKKYFCKIVNNVYNVEYE